MTHTRSVTTPPDDITADAARADGPATATVVDAGVTDAGELELTLAGERL